jgi:hypothetical protein
MGMTPNILKSVTGRPFVKNETKRVGKVIGVYNQGFNFLPGNRLGVIKVRYLKGWRTIFFAFCYRDFL